MCELGVNYDVGYCFPANGSQFGVGEWLIRRVVVVALFVLLPIVAECDCLTLLSADADDDEHCGQSLSLNCLLVGGGYYDC